MRKLMVATVVAVLMGLALPALAHNFTGTGDCDGWTLNLDGEWGAVDILVDGQSVGLAQQVTIPDTSDATSRTFVVTWDKPRGQSDVTVTRTLTRSGDCQETTTTTTVPEETTTVPEETTTVPVETTTTHPETTTTQPETTTTVVEGSCVDLNTANEAELTSVSGISTQMAMAIIAATTFGQNGDANPFQSVFEAQVVFGFGDDALAPQPGSPGYFSDDCLTVPSTTTTDPGSTTSTGVVAPASDDSSTGGEDELPFTGIPTGLLAGLGGLLTATGGLLVRKGRSS